MGNKAGEFTILRPLKAFMGRDNPEVRASLASYFSGGLAISCWLYRPPENYDFSPRGMHPLDMPAPEGGALVVGHGGVDGVPAHYDYVLRRLAYSGWHIAAPGYRGEDGSDGEIEFAKGEVDDTLACFEALTALPGVKAEKTWLLGSSHGAMVSLLALAKDGGRKIPGAIVLAGVYDLFEWIDWLEESGHFLHDDAHLKAIYELSDAEKRMRSAKIVADKIEAPVMLFHGEDDTLVPCEMSKSMGDEFARTGKINYSLIIEPGEDHEYIWGPERPAARRMWDAALRFIESNGRIADG